MMNGLLAITCACCIGCGAGSSNSKVNAPTEATCVYHDSIYVKTEEGTVQIPRNTIAMIGTVLPIHGVIDVGEGMQRCVR